MNPKILAWLQVGLGLTGLVVCGGLYFNYSGPLQESCEQLDQLAGDARDQAEIADQVLDQWGDLLTNLDRALSTHQQSLEEVERSRSQLIDSVDDWRLALVGFSGVTDDAASVCDKFAKRLPIKVPTMDYETREIAVEIPQFQLKEETVRLPYPTARVGSRKMKLDLGLTQVDLDVPTINLGTREKVVKVPNTPDVSTRSEKFTVPNNVRIQYELLLTEERDLLHKTAEQMRSTSATLDTTAQRIVNIKELIENDLSQSLATTSDNLAQTQAQLRDSHEVQIPKFQRRLKSEARGFDRSQASFQKIEGLIPWLFLLVGIIPCAVLLQGLQGVMRVEGDALSEHSEIDA